MSDNNPFGVRRADAMDYNELLAFVLEVVQEDALQPVSEAKVAATVGRCVLMESAIAGIISGPNGIEGSVGLVLDQFPLSDEDHLAARWLGTSKSYRERIRTAKRRGYHPDDLGNAARLMRFSKWASDTMGVPLIINVLTTDSLAFKIDSFSRQTPQVGATFGWGVMPDHQFFNQHIRGGWVKDGGSPGSSPGAKVRQSSAGRQDPGSGEEVRNAETALG